MKTIYVSPNAPDTFHSLQEAVLSVPDDRQERVRICVMPGIYEEKVFIRKENLEIIGQNPETTIFRYGDGARKPLPDNSGEYGTFNTAVILLAGKDLHMENLTVENTAGPGRTAGQALAVYVAADRCSFSNCRFLGWQDTLFAGEALPCRMKSLKLPDFFNCSSVPIEYPILRNYFKDCYISGDVDFIFGSNVVFFEQCEIFSKKQQGESHSFITAANTPAGQEFGLVFSHCRLTGDGKPASVYLGRPWRDFAKTAFVHCYLGEHICPEGWQNWQKARAEVLCSYVEYANDGPGARTDNRAAFSRQLSNPDLETYYSRENVLAGDDGWNGYGSR